MSLTIYNLYQGRDSLGNKIIHSTNNSRINNKSLAFAVGFLSELAAEFAVPTFIASASDSIKWYHVIAADISIKTIPRGIERLIKHWKNVDKEFISS